MRNIVTPSINCSDFACVKERLKISEALRQAQGISNFWVHVDISDGKFTPHISWNNPEEISNLKSQISNLNVEVHLMVEDPEAQIDAWLRAGAKRIIAHLEAMRDPVYIAEKCKKYGAEFFLAINPATEVERLLVYLDDVDGVLTLGVFPGPSGQEMKQEILVM